MGVHTRFLPEARNLFSSDASRSVLARNAEQGNVVWFHDPDGPQELGALVANGIRVKRRKRLHADGGHYLQQMVLNHVAQRARFLVVGPAPLYSDRFGGGNLHAANVTPVPEGLKDAIAESKCKDVLHRLFAEVVIDAIDLFFGEYAVQRAVQLSRALEIVPERLLHHDSPPARTLVESS